MINFNVPYIPADTATYLNKVLANKKLCGDGEMTKLVHAILAEHFGKKALLTTSCTHAIEMAALLANIGPGDEVIMPSFTFVSTANPFVLRGARIIFVDIKPGDMNMDENLVEAAITSKTKAIVPMHYGGVSCNMEAINKIAAKYNLYVIEDAAQCTGSYYKNKPVGTQGDFAAFSFHETKNIQCGEGGALIINRKEDEERSEIIREKGTNRSNFIRGIVDKYTWMDLGSSYLPSELNAAMLVPQLQDIQNITNKRLAIWNRYKNNLESITGTNIEIAEIPADCTSNGHLFYIKCADITERNNMITHLKTKDIQTVFHYIPLHSAPSGLKFGEFRGNDTYTTTESERLLRLPLHLELTKDNVDHVSESIIQFYS